MILIKNICIIIHYLLSSPLSLSLYSYHINLYTHNNDYISIILLNYPSNIYHYNILNLPTVSYSHRTLIVLSINILYYYFIYYLSISLISHILTKDKLDNLVNLYLNKSKISPFLMTKYHCNFHICFTLILMEQHIF
jgi:hypothetical protein